MNRYKYLFIVMFFLIIGGCNAIGVYSTPEDAMKHQLKATSFLEEDDGFELKSIITVDKDFAFYLTPSNNISVAHFEKKNSGWDVTGATGRTDLEELEFSKSGISPTMGLSNDRILYGFSNDHSIKGVSYHSVNGKIIDLTEYLPNKLDYKYLKLWYIAFPEEQQVDLENLEGLSFTNSKGDILRYEEQ